MARRKLNKKQTTPRVGTYRDIPKNATLKDIGITYKNAADNKEKLAKYAASKGGRIPTLARSQDDVRILNYEKKNYYSGRTSSQNAEHKTSRKASPSSLEAWVTPKGELTLRSMSHASDSEAMRGAVRAEGRSSRRSNQVSSVNRQATKNRIKSGPSWSEGVAKYDFQLTPKINRDRKEDYQRNLEKSTGRLLGKATQVAGAQAKRRGGNYSYDRYDIKRNDKIPTITIKGGKRDMGYGDEARWKASTFSHGDISERPYHMGGSGTRKRRDLDNRIPSQRVKVPHWHEPTIGVKQTSGLVKSKAQAEKQIEKTYGKANSYYESKVVGKKVLKVHPNKPVVAPNRISGGRYEWVEDTTRGESRTTSERRKLNRKKMK